VASTPGGERLTEAHRQQQVAIRSGFLAEFLPMWTLMNWNRIDETSPEWVRLVMAIVRLWRQESANVAESYYDRYRQIEVPRVSTPAPLITFQHAPDVRGVRALDQSLDLDFGDSDSDQLVSLGDDVDVELGDDVHLIIDWTEFDKAAEKSLLVTGPGELKRQAARGETEQRARDRALVTSSGAASRHVLNGGRETLLTQVTADKTAIGYIRVTDGDPCSFCAMLAGRGPVFKSTSFGGSDPRFEGGFGDARVHDNCACTLEPVYSESSGWPGDSKLWGQLWDDNIKGKYSGRDALNAWRRLYTQMQRDQAKLEQAIA
jgi:hypothetical protein